MVMSTEGGPHSEDSEAGSYVPLWVKSNVSFLEGASHPEELVERCQSLGLTTMALTDRNSVGGVVRAHVKAKSTGLELIVGAEVTLLDSQACAPSKKKSPGTEHPAKAQTLVLLCENRAGYGRLCRLLTLGHKRGPKGQCAVSWTELEKAAPGLFALCATPALMVPCASLFEGHNAALCVRHHRPQEAALEAELRGLAGRLDTPIVAGTEVLYHAPGRRFLADVLTCIKHGRRLEDAGTLLRANAEHYLPSAADMARRFADMPEALRATFTVAERCKFRLSDLSYRYPSEHLPEGESEQSWLSTLSWRGAAARYGGQIPNEVRKQLERELSLIEELRYDGYFLTMWDVVRFCKQENILCQGRGSAANSAVCYCLGITAIDPIAMDLLFERFLSRERAEPPDIDLDIEHERREEVIQYVYKRWGRRRAAMVANVIRYRAKSALRDVGQVLGLPETALQRAAKLLSGYGEGLSEEVLVQAGLDPGQRRIRQLMRLVAELQNFPRHLSIHPGGFLLGAEPIDTLVPVEDATMPGRTVVQWDKQDVEDMGLFKVDLLGLGMLSQLRRSFELLESSGGPSLTMATVPTEDRETYEMISKADTVGVFQIESRAQMSMLPRLKPATFYDLVIEVAIVRPGPIQGDMVHPYLRRRDGLEPVTYPHPALKRVLDKTLGVPIFQEQVMRLAVEVAGYSPGEADQLRRDMAAWRSKGKIEQHEQRFVGEMVSRGIPVEFANKVFSQIRGFGEYGFPESHAASFALLSYLSAWFKCHHHAVFTCALLNAWPMGFYHPSTLVEDAKRHGVEVRPIRISAAREKGQAGRPSEYSRWECTLEKTACGPHSHAIRMGLSFVKGLGDKERQRLEAVSGPFRNLKHFAQVSGLNTRSLSALAEAGALAGFGLNRRQALWAIAGLPEQERAGRQVSTKAQRGRPQATLGPELWPSMSKPNLPAFSDLARVQEVNWDYRASLHSTRGHPMSRLRAALSEEGLMPAEVLNASADGRRVTYVGMVICRQRPMTAGGVTFMTLEDETGFVNLVVWQDVYERHRTVAKTAVLLRIEGRVQSQHGVTHLVARTLAEDPQGLAITSPKSRDFH